MPEQLTALADPARAVAMRAYARWNPQAVCDFVAAMGEGLSPLSAREAMRRIT